MTMTDAIEEVILLDDEGRTIGRAPKAGLHGADTALHLAFSCHVRNRDGQVLVTRRALSKAAWPGVWTNSFCGHPQPAEPMLAAVRRRAEYELGLTISNIELALPLFRYRATDASGVVENEICPVYLAVTDDEPHAHPLEVMDTAWVSREELGESIASTPWVFSPWLVLQARLLNLLGGSPEALAADEREAVDIADESVEWERTA
jgi:isopentenyl-diphosphate delta-isomerase